MFRDSHSEKYPIAGDRNLVRHSRYALSVVLYWSAARAMALPMAATDIRFGISARDKSDLSAHSLAASLCKSEASGLLPRSILGA